MISGLRVGLFALGFVIVAAASAYFFAQSGAKNEEDAQEIIKNQNRTLTKEIDVKTASTNSFSRPRSNIVTQKDNRNHLYSNQEADIDAEILASDSREASISVEGGTGLGQPTNRNEAGATSASNMNPQIELEVPRSAISFDNYKHVIDSKPTDRHDISLNKTIKDSNKKKQQLSSPSGVNSNSKDAPAKSEIYSRQMVNNNQTGDYFSQVNFTATTPSVVDSIRDTLKSVNSTDCGSNFVNENELDSTSPTATLPLLDYKLKIGTRLSSGPKHACLEDLHQSKFENPVEGEFDISRPVILEKRENLPRYILPKNGTVFFRHKYDDIIKSFCNIEDSQNQKLDDSISDLFRSLNWSTTPKKDPAQIFSEIAQLLWKDVKDKFSPKEIEEVGLNDESFLPQFKSDDKRIKMATVASCLLIDDSSALEALIDDETLLLAVNFEELIGLLVHWKAFDCIRFLADFFCSHDRQLKTKLNFPSLRMKLLGTAIKYDILRKEKFALIADLNFYNCIIDDLMDNKNLETIIFDSVDNNYLELLAAFFVYETELAKIFWDFLAVHGVECFMRTANQPTLSQSLLFLLPKVFEHAGTLRPTVDFVPLDDYDYRKAPEHRFKHFIDKFLNHHKKNFWALSFYAHLYPDAQESAFEHLPDDQKDLIRKVNASGK